MADEGELTLQEAADRLGVHYMTAYRYVRLGLLPARKEGSSWRVDPTDLDRLRQDGDAQSPAPARGKGRSQPAPWAERLEHRLREGDEAGSWGVVEAALSGGMSPAGVYLELLSPALRGIGDSWAAGQLDIAVEHRASSIVLRLIGRLGPRFARRGRSRGSVVIGCPPGERHGLPGALLADLVRGAGFNVMDLGADVPGPSLALSARETPRLVAVALSVTSPGNDAAVEEAIASVREAVDVPVLLGGWAIPDEATATRLGGDGWAADGPGAVRLLEDLVAR